MNKHSQSELDVIIIGSGLAGFKARPMNYAVRLFCAGYR